MTIGPKFEVGKYITLFVERTNRDKGLEGREVGGNYPPPSRFYKNKKRQKEIIYYCLPPKIFGPSDTYNKHFFSTMVTITIEHF